MENVNKEIRKALTESKAARQEAVDFLVLQGENIDLADWVTAREYAERFGAEQHQRGNQLDSAWHHTRPKTSVPSKHLTTSV